MHAPSRHVLGVIATSQSSAHSHHTQPHYYYSHHLSHHATRRLDNEIGRYSSHQVNMMSYSSLLKSPHSAKTERQRLQLIITVIASQETIKHHHKPVTTTFRSSLYSHHTLVILNSVLSCPITSVITSVITTVVTTSHEDYTTPFPSHHYAQ